VSEDTIRYNLKKNHIEIQKSNHKHKITDKEDIDSIIKLYCDELWSSEKIAKQYKTGHNVIIRLLQNNGIKTRGSQEAQLLLTRDMIPDEFYDANFLQRLHWEENKTCEQIGEILGGMDAGTVRKQMQRLGVPTKTNSESKIGLMKGDKHPNWKGGITPLYKLLREFCTTNISPKIWKRDNYTCQLCGATHTVVHAHHIIPLKEIVNTIIDEHKELDISNVDDM